MADAAAAAELYRGCGGVRALRGRVTAVVGGDPVLCLVVLRRGPLKLYPPGPVPPTGVSLPSSSTYLPPPPGPPGMYRSFFSGLSEPPAELGRFGGRTRGV